MDGKSNIDIYDVALAAFLHDIGKFAQRGQVKKYYDSSQNEYYCNKYKNGYSNLHAVYTAGFISKNKDKFTHYFQIDQIIELAAKHHLPENNFQYIIQSADILSAGSDRINKKTINEEEKKYYEQPLISIFSQINLFGNGNNNSNVNKKYYNLKVYDGDNLFPKENIKLSRDDYKNFFENFEDEFINFSNKFNEFYNSDFSLSVKKDIYLKSFDSLMEKYTWCIPSSTVSEPDISLYDHLYTTASFASVLFNYHEEDGSLNNIDKINNKNIKKFILISGDMSGIQKSIFDLETSKYNAKILRGRSFEIQALTELSSSFILNELNLPHFCKIMNAGGRFILLLPNTNKVKNKLKEIRVKIEKYFLNRYFGELSLILSNGIELNSNDFLIKDNEKEPGYFKKMQEDITEAKFKKFYSILNGQNHILSGHYDRITKNQDVCKICGKRVKENLKNNNENKEDDEKFCSVCNQQILMGKILPKSKYFYILKLKEKLINNIKNTSYIEFLDNIYFFSSINNIFEKNSVYKNSILFNQYSINNFEPNYHVFNTPFYLPVKGNSDSENTEDNNKSRYEIMTFKDIAETSEGVEKIAMLKSDIDNLGAIFNIGFKNDISISRYSSLSRMVNFFFSNYINKTLSSLSEYKNIYTVFSGGDDLCLIGPWNVIIDYAIFINKKFKKFTGENRNVTLSAGISINRHNIPVRFLAEDAEDNLEITKDKGKNGITLFKTKVDWDEFEKLIKKDAQFLLKYYDNSGNNKNKISSSLLYSFLYFYDANKIINNENKVVYIKELNNFYIWKSHLHYRIARLFDEENKDIKDKLVEFVKNKIKYLIIPVSYVLYLKKNNK